VELTWARRQCLWVGFASALLGGSALALAPEAVQRALALEERGDDAGALATLDRLVKEEPAWELPRLEAARLRLKAGSDLDRAELDLETARAIAPENPRGHFLWAMLAQERGRPAEAVSALERAVALRSGYADAWFRLAPLYAELERWADAEQAYRELLRYRSDSLQARFALAQVLEKQNKLEDTERELRRLLDENPIPVVRERLADFYRRTDRPKLAEKALKGTPAKKVRKLRPLPKSRR
jgi:tetratricopeptide (TPR) repeat protein